MGSQFDLSARLLIKIALADRNVRFYVRTREAVYATSERSEEALGKKEDPLWPLFYAGQGVITQFRIVAPEFGR